MLPTLMRRRQGSDMSPLPRSRDLEGVFDDFMGWWRGDGRSILDETAAYPVDIREEDGRLIVDAELPGFTREQVEVTLDQGVLNIRAEHRQERDETGKTHLRERRYRRIERSFTLPTAVDESKVEATLKDGVLHLTLQKSKEAIARKIQVK